MKSQEKITKKQLSLLAGIFGPWKKKSAFFIESDVDQNIYNGFW